ncbi:MAG: TlpA family protein disulfide reductase [Methylococcaceae bacterium]|nr:TlpA family protein disulfide reductase [Methylococcaceae bacterium]
MKKNLLFIIIATLAITSGVLTRNSWSLKQTTIPLPAFNLSDLSGKQHDISEWKGKILIINFWATWCPPCKKEIPEFIALQNDYSDQGLQFIGVAIDNRNDVNEFLTTIKINYPILIAEDEGIALINKLGDTSGTVPFTVVVDPDGQIIYRHPGNFSKNQIMALVGPLLTKQL